MNKILTLCFTCSFFIGCSQNKTVAFFYVKTNDSLPFLKYGIGDDRLGGAKMTSLDSNIILKVVDSFKEDYKVQLSHLHSAWVEKRHVAKTNFVDSLPHLTTDWKVYGDSLYDYVTIELNHRLPYASRMEIDPSKIIIDIFGVVSNTNWIAQLSSSKEIKNAWYEQTEDDMVRVFIELQHQQDWGYHIFYDSSNKLTVRIKRQPNSLNLKNLTIAVDAGHGGTNIGTTISKPVLKEKDYTLLFAKDVENALLNEKAKVIMTRETDTTLSMYERISMLDQQHPDLLISIHLNASDRDTVQGVSTYYRYIGFRPLSVAILKSLGQLGLREYGNIGSFNFALNGPTDYPNCLIEVGFLSNKEDRARILDPAFRVQVAKSIVAGIKDFLKNL